MKKNYNDNYMGKGKENLLDNSESGTDSELSSESSKSEKYTKLDKGKGKEIANDNQSKDKGPAMDTRSQVSDGNQHITDTSPPSPGLNTSDSDSKKSAVDSIFEIPEHLRHHETSISQANPNLGGGGPSNRRRSGESSASSAEVFEGERYDQWLHQSTLRDIKWEFIKGKSVLNWWGIKTTPGPHSISGTADDLPNIEPEFRRANSETSIPNRWGRAELNLMVEKALKIDSKKTRRILRERDHMYDVTPEQIMDPNFTLDQLSCLDSTSSENSDDKRSDSSKLSHFSNGGSGGGPSGPNNTGGPSSTGGSGGASGSGTVQFSLINFEEFFMIIPYLLGFVSIIFAINPEIFMYIRLLITLMSNPAFKLYLYFKYIKFLCIFNRIKCILFLIIYNIWRLVYTILTYLLTLLPSLYIEVNKFVRFWAFRSVF
jgi:hypothetical protein